MKKITLLVLALLLVLSLFSCQNKTNDNNTETTAPETENTNSTDTTTWDGSIANAFEGGDGTEESPYLIANGAQLAYLAKSVNDGSSYADKYISLICDIDLNNIEWTPIGNGKIAFEGSFDGNNHTITNLKIENGLTFRKEYSGGVSSQYVTGLFGVCGNLTIKNLKIDEATVEIKNIKDQNNIYAGILSGTIRTNLSVKISNVSISNSTISTDFSQEKKPTCSLSAGGLCGYIFGENNSECEINNIQSNLSVSIQNSNGSYNNVGGIVGNLSTNNSCNIQDCSSCLSIKIDPKKCYSQNISFGAFGITTCSNNIVSLSNIFSKASVNKIYDYYGNAAYTANAIIGKVYHGKQSDGSVIGGYKFENLFGFIEQIDKSTTERKISTQLYKLPDHAIYAETNCLGCETLPENHGFDTNIWDLSNLANPKLK